MTSLLRDYKEGKITLRTWYDRVATGGGASSPKSRGMAGKGQTTKIGRDAKTGQFIPVDVAKRRPSTTTVETIKKSGKK